MQLSELKLYSKGTVAENLVVGLRTIQVSPDEALSFVDGALKANPTEDTTTGLDAQGNTVATKVVTDNTITATWLPFHSNRHTPPDVRRGERVLVWRFADLDTFYWTELGLDQKLRAQETAVYLWNGTPDVGGAEPSTTSSYYMEISTHKGLVTFSTSKANGEKTSHTVQLNPMEGKLIVKDDLGQLVYIDSTEHLIHLVNADKSEVTIEKQDVTLYCEDTMNLTGQKAMNLTTKTLNIKATTFNIHADTMIADVDSTTFAGSSMTVNSNSVNLNAPSIKLGGVTIANGKFTGVTGLASSGPVTAPNIS